MDTDQNWYRQLGALVLLSASRAAVEFLTNPSSRQDAQKQLKSSFAEIDYAALANALTTAIDNVASTSKSSLDEAIDSLRDRSVDAVEEAKSRAEDKLGQKKGGRKMRFFFGLLIGGLIAYFVLDEQRRDELLDKLTGASGPIQTSMPSSSGMSGNASSTAQQGANSVGTMAHEAADTVSGSAQTAADSVESTAQQAADATE